ncbi:MAG: SPOR domain-containing protein [Aquificaceae bacterium]
MKKERLIVLLGLLIALIFFYLGLNQWLKTKEEVQPPPVTVKPPPPQEQEIAPKPEAPPQDKKEEAPQKPPEKDPIAQRIKEEKSVETKTPQRKKAPKAETKSHTVQVGAFLNKEKAQKVAEKAERMGYKVSIVEEDNFYKVRLKIASEDINSELKKLRNTFGGAILVR